VPGLVLNHIRKRIEWRKHARSVDRMSDLEEFRRYVEQVRPQLFLQYEAVSAQKRLEFVTVVDELRIPLASKNFLDIGPGYGDSLAVCRQGGGSADFVEWDPFFFGYNRLKGFARGYRINHLRQLSRLQPNKYDFIWVKGSVAADFFIRWKWLIPLPRWLKGVERLGRASCKILICPYWDERDGKRRVADVQDNWFSDTMLKCGYFILRRIKNHNSEPSYPITFWKET